MSWQEKEKKSSLLTTDIKVVLPKGYNNFTNDLSNSVLEKICMLVFQSKDFVKEFERRTTGRYIKVIRNSTNETHFVCVSNPSNDARNAHLMQFVSPTYTEFFKCPCKNKRMDIYLLNPDKNDKTNYIKVMYRCFLTIGIKVLNLTDLSLAGITSFTTYDELKRYRNETSSRNRHNNQTYFSDDETHISLYGKTFGANAMESFIFALTLAKLVTKRIIFYPVFDNDSKTISKDQKAILMSNNIEYGNVIFELNNSDIKYEGQTEKSLRDTPKFHYNLLKKFGEKRCYLCGCDLEHLLIGSHIERVADIKKNEKYSKDEKIARIVDGDNGFWLCANHDKLFEFGQIFFEHKKLSISTMLDEQDNEFLDKSIYGIRQIYFSTPNKPFEIEKEHYNTNMAQYLKKHLQRVRVKLVA